MDEDEFLGSYRMDENEFSGSCFMDEDFFKLIFHC